MDCQLENAGETVQHFFMLDSHVITDETIRNLAKNMFSETHREYFETSPLFEDLREEGMLEAVIKNYLHVSQDLKIIDQNFFMAMLLISSPKNYL